MDEALNMSGCGGDIWEGGRLRTSANAGDTRTLADDREFCVIMR
jgi:hypothetical protein